MYQCSVQIKFCILVPWTCIIQHTHTTSSSWPIRDNGISFAETLKVFSLLITCSIKILWFAICLVFCTHVLGIWDLPLFPGGTNVVIHVSLHSMEMLNSLSSMIVLYGGTLSKYPHCSVIALSDIRPVVSDIRPVYAVCCCLGNTLLISLHWCDVCYNSMCHFVNIYI